MSEPYAGVRQWSTPEQLKYFSARFVHRHRTDCVLDANKKPVTWQDWWERRYHEKLDAYIETVLARIASEQYEMLASGNTLR